MVLLISGFSMSRESKVAKTDLHSLSSPAASIPRQSRYQAANLLVSLENRKTPPIPSIIGFSPSASLSLPNFCRFPHRQAQFQFKVRPVHRAFFVQKDLECRRVLGLVRTVDQPISVKVVPGR